MKPPENRDVVTIRDIATGLDELRFQRGLDESTKALLEAVHAGRWDAIAEAALLLQRENLPRMHKERLKDYAKTIASRLMLDPDLELGKSEVLEYIEKVHPDIFAVLNTSARGLTDWWREMGFNAKGWQARGKKDRAFKDQFEKMIESAIRNRKAGFPDFLGPRENPMWDGNR